MLTVSEQRVRRGAPIGKPVDLAGGAALDLDDIGAWTGEQNVRAGWLADLLSITFFDMLVPRRGIRGRTGDSLHPEPYRKFGC